MRSKNSNRRIKNLHKRPRHFTQCSLYEMCITADFRIIPFLRTTSPTFLLIWRGSILKPRPNRSSPVMTPGGSHAWPMVKSAIMRATLYLTPVLRVAICFTSMRIPHRSTATMLVSTNSFYKTTPTPTDTTSGFFSGCSR
jgi:hypothetical protein